MADDEEEDQNITIGVSKYPCMPSLVALQQMRNRLHLAHLGRKLMKWTSLATHKELRNVSQNLIIASKDYGEEVREAYILLARCRFNNPNLNNMVVEDVLMFPNEAITTVNTSYKHVTGVLECRLEVLRSEEVPYPHLGVEKGGELITEAKRVWFELLRKMVLILQLQLDFLAAEGSHKAATKMMVAENMPVEMRSVTSPPAEKANVLSKIIIPKITLTIHYILAELEEKEREEIFRLKRVKQKWDKKKAMMRQLRDKLEVKVEPLSLKPKQHILIDELADKSTQAKEKYVDIICKCPSYKEKHFEIAVYNKPKTPELLSQSSSKKSCIECVAKEDETVTKETAETAEIAETEPCEIQKDIIQQETEIVNDAASIVDTDADNEICAVCRTCTPDKMSCRSEYYDADDTISSQEDYYRIIERLKGAVSNICKSVRFSHGQTQTCCSKPGSRISRPSTKKSSRLNAFKTSTYKSRSLRYFTGGIIRVPIEIPVSRTRSLPLRRTKSIGRHKSGSNSTCAVDCPGNDSNKSRTKVKDNKQTQATCDPDCGMTNIMIDVACDTDYDEARVYDSDEHCTVHNYDEIDDYYNNYYE